MRHVLGCLMAVALTNLSVDSSYFGNEQPFTKKNSTPLDAFGDPLPDGVHYRLGTVRLRHVHVATMLFSSDGTKLLSHGGTENLRLWDVATGRLLQQLPAPEGRTHLIASPDDRFVACVANSHQVVLMDKTSGKELARWNHRLSWLRLAFSKDSKELLG